MAQQRRERRIHPELSQAMRSPRNYFEGWYFKQLASSAPYTVCLIPGISISRRASHAFIQVITSPEMKTTYFTFPTSDFFASASRFDVRIGPNRFNSEGMIIDLHNGQESISGRLYFGPFEPLRHSRWMPNIMGPFAYMPMMECNHGVISMGHTVSGMLKINNNPLYFNGTRGYLEKDWGRSFPKWYIWLQCNHFNRQDVRFMCSIAEVPFLGVTFKGIICSLIFNGQEHRLATYTAAKVKGLSSHNQCVSFTIESGQYQLYVKAQSKRMGPLKAPQAGMMQHSIKEGIEGSIELCLKNRQGECLLQTQGEHAGIEIEMQPSGR